VWLHISTNCMIIFRPFGQHKIQDHSWKFI